MVLTAQPTCCAALLRLQPKAIMEQIWARLMESKTQRRGMVSPLSFLLCPLHWEFFVREAQR
jgi:hypothetical protein